MEAGDSLLGALSLSRAAKTRPGELQALVLGMHPRLTSRPELFLRFRAPSAPDALDVLVADRVLEHPLGKRRNTLKTLRVKMARGGHVGRKDVCNRLQPLLGWLPLLHPLTRQTEFIAKGRLWLAGQVAILSGAVETSSCLGALIATETRERIEDEPTITNLVQLLIASHSHGTWIPNDSYPLVYGIDSFTAPLSDQYEVVFGLLLAERALLKGCNQARREILWARSRPKPTPRQPVDSIEMARIQEEFLALGQRMAGTPSSIGQRVVVHYSVYRDSRRNLTFPLLALHGAAWAHGYFNFLVSLLPFYATLRFPPLAGKTVTRSRRRCQ